MANDNYKKEGIVYLKCKECGDFKKLNLFYAHKKGFLGVLGRCKKCIKKGRRTEREKVMARRRDSERYYGNKKRREYIFKSAKDRRAKKGYGNIHLKTQRYIKKNGERPKICPICNKKHRRIEAHHYDYSKWNEIIFACSICHSALDRGEIDYNTCDIINILNPF